MKKSTTTAAAKQQEIDRKVAEYAAVARKELARLTALVASYEAKVDSADEAAPVANWADVNEVADLARALKETFSGFQVPASPTAQLDAAAHARIKAKWNR